MTADASHEANELFVAARRGSTTCLGQLLALYANYLKLLVSTQLDCRLRARVSPSDVVQDTFFEAHRDFPKFRGESLGEFVEWLRRIVINNILRVVEQHVLTEKRDVRREVSLQEIGQRLEQSTVRLETFLAGHSESPSGQASRREDELRLADTLAALPNDYRNVIVLRHVEGLSFEEVATRMDRSAGAVRMLWLRALKRLRELLTSEG
jgi:RNA polymerase sigma-70 factor, ECF subfamily